MLPTHFLKLLVIITIILLYPIYSRTIPENLIQLKNSIAVFDLYTNELVYQRNAKEQLIPASVAKLITTINALSVLSPYYVFEVQIYKRDNRILISSNYNPSLIEEIIPDPYNFLKEGIRNILEANQIENIQTVEIDNSLPSYYPESWKIYEGEPFAPYISTFSFNQNMIKIQRIQDKLTIYPSAFPELQDQNILSNLISNLTYIDGAYWYVYPSPEEYIKKIIRKLFIDLGYNVNVTLKTTVDYNHYDNIGSFPTCFLIQALKQQNFWSDNFISQKLYYKLKFEKKFDINQEYSGLGIVMDDGCGLSRKNRINCYSLAMLLSLMDDYYLLPYLIYTLPGYNEGTLQKRNLPRTIKAKTGTLNDVSSLAGYVKTKKNKWYSFSIIYNGPYTYQAKVIEEQILNYIYSNW
ncbi:MAG: D-alanyl-D-alanine carboxypeptidase [bacterium]